MISQAWQEKFIGAARPQPSGRVAQMVGSHIEIEGVDAAVGEAVEIELEGVNLMAEVVALRGQRLICMPLGSTAGVRFGAKASSLRRPPALIVGPDLLGRVVNANGDPIDGKGQITPVDMVSVRNSAPPPMTRSPIASPLGLGIRVIDSMTPCGVGQRIGVFAGSGVGKSTLLSMMVRGTEAEVRVIALIGERGREVLEFIDRDLGEEGMRSSVVVVATSDEPALMRIRAAFAATRIAEWFREQGKSVLLVMDSLTRLAMAQREVGLLSGEPPAQRGYPPSVFSQMAQILERAGNSDVGSITGIYSVLVDGDDMNDPIADAARSILDGHIVLSRDIASSGVYPAVDVLSSVSRLESAILESSQRKLLADIRGVLAHVRNARDLIDIGAYKRGGNPKLDRAIDLEPKITSVFLQDQSQITSPKEAWNALFEIFCDGEEF